MLRFNGREDVQLAIPPGSLEKENQMVYMKLLTDSLSDRYSASPVVECGPNGLKTNTKAGITIVI